MTIYKKKSPTNKQDRVFQLVNNTFIILVVIVCQKIQTGVQIPLKILVVFHFQVIPKHIPNVPMVAHMSKKTLFYR